MITLGANRTISRFLIAWLAFCSLSALFNVTIHHETMQSGQETCLPIVHGATDTCENADDFPVESESLIDHIFEHGAMIAASHHEVADAVTLPMVPAVLLPCDCGPAAMSAASLAMPSNVAPSVVDFSSPSSPRAPPLQS